jgi:hypothetical protein
MHKFSNHGEKWNAAWFVGKEKLHHIKKDPETRHQYIIKLIKTQRVEVFICGGTYLSWLQKVQTIFFCFAILFFPEIKKMELVFPSITK